jgi:DNA-binding protein H-NS
MDDLEKLQAQIADLQRQAEDLLNQKRTAVIADIRSKMRVYAITVKDLGVSTKTSSRSGTPVAVKYRHPEEPSLSWTGRGRQPKWVVEYVESGGTLKDLFV